MLQKAAEDLASEVELQESRILMDAALQEHIGIPRSLRAVLASLRGRQSSNVRSMRFDFHPTKTGWRVSEVNSDVPGGWREATTLPALFEASYPELGVPESPLAAWSDSIRELAGSGCVALLSAAGFLEDLQVIYAFQRELSRIGTKSVLIQSPGALEWRPGKCRTRSGFDVSVIVRFYQVEWLARLNRCTHWQDLLLSTFPRTVNPTAAVVSESKRFPLAFSSPRQEWQSFVPESRDPRLVDSGEWDDWVLKAAYSNTGDEIHLCSDIEEKRRRRIVRTAQKNHRAWVAQRRFETITLDSELGPLFPCVGVFVVNGRAAGAYARLSRTRIVDGAAIEAPVLIDESEYADLQG